MTSAVLTLDVRDRPGIVLKVVQREVVSQLFALFSVVFRSETNCVSSDAYKLLNIVMRCSHENKSLARVFVNRGIAKTLSVKYSEALLSFL